jgi:hypothetical protein
MKDVRMVDNYKETRRKRFETYFTIMETQKCNLLYV